MLKYDHLSVILGPRPSLRSGRLYVRESAIAPVPASGGDRWRAPPSAGA
ncbi:MAG: hypothetical protein ACPKM1_18045 [Spirochaetaceae bacterium]